MLTLSPAYGRDYKSQKAVQADWDAGKDFVVETMGHGMYANKADLKGEKVMVRYAKLRKVMVVS